MVQLRAVQRTYPGPPPVEALRPTTLSIDGGEYVAIIGPSGSGKSTLINLLGLLDRPTAGTYLLEGVEVGSLAERERTALRARRMGVVFQSYHLMPYRTAAENVALAQLYVGVSRRIRRSGAYGALEQVGLAKRSDALPSTLSGGERQRVAIARALLNHPSLLLCDEPTGNLDSAATESLLQLLGVLNREGLTILVITHDPAVASHAVRTLSVRDGVVSEHGRPLSRARP